MNRIFKGKWLVRYDPNEFQYPHVLELLTEMIPEHKENDQNTAYNQIFLDKRINKTANLQLNEVLGNGIKEIQTVHLVSPVRMNDKRWDTIPFTTASLFLGSALTEAGFHVTTGKLIMPAATVDERLTQTDLLGFTLFEDLFAETRAFLDLLSQTGVRGLLAGGGPMATLNPLQTARHLPHLNLVVRGEAEFVLPRLLEAHNNNDLPALLEMKGFLFQVPGILIISDLDYVHMPEDFPGFRFNLDFLEPGHLERGLEINLSRGCRRGCIFCSHVQGRTFRKLPLQMFDQLLTDLAHTLDVKKSVIPRDSRTININDDDILQDMEYARAVFGVVKKHSFKLWGVQTSLDSFFKRDHALDPDVLDVLADGDLFVDGSPLAWVGTDAFLKERGKRLAKWIPQEKLLHELMKALEERKIRHFHYWISSDFDTDWQEFTREFRLLYGFHKTYGNFGLLAHSPFLVPYNTTPLYRMAASAANRARRIKYKQVLSPGKELFRFPLVNRVETRYAHLNRLLSNERLYNRLGFFDYLKIKDYTNAFITLYDFLKMERLSMEAAYDTRAEGLSRIEKDVEEFISTII